MFRVLLCFIVAIGVGCKSKAPNPKPSPTKHDTITLIKPSTKEKPEPKPGPGISQEVVSTGAEEFISEVLRSDWERASLGLITNHTSMVNGVHLVDTLLAIGLEVKKVFAPEHGFRGAADAGQKIQNSTDPTTGLPILSLYGKTRKPTADFLSGIDILIFDIQDIGSRHYTYISTMTLAMEACAEQGKEFIVLDRPNPNGSYVGGPLMDPQYSTFIGMHKVPIVHGMTVGEYATMVNEEGWLAGGVRANLKVIPCKGYRHSMSWEETKLPWIAPSPNIPTEYAAYLYPALCWFEPTIVSVGRGTHEAFTFIGAPWFLRFAEGRTSEDLSLFGLTYEPYNFTPVSLPGKSTYPKYQDAECQGIRFTNRVAGDQLFKAGISLLKLMHEEAGKNAPDKSFFTGNFERWAGNSALEEQITSGKDVEQIWDSWQEEIEEFKGVRKKYLIYE